MADLKISALPSSTTPLAGTEVLPIVQSSTTKQVSVTNLTSGRTVEMSIGLVNTTTARTNVLGSVTTPSKLKERLATILLVRWSETLPMPTARRSTWEKAAAPRSMATLSLRLATHLDELIFWVQMGLILFALRPYM